MHWGFVFSVHCMRTIFLVCCSIFLEFPASVIDGDPFVTGLHMALVNREMREFFAALDV